MFLLNVPRPPNYNNLFTIKVYENKPTGMSTSDSHPCTYLRNCTKAGQRGMACKIVLRATKKDGMHLILGILMPAHAIPTTLGRLHTCLRQPQQLRSPTG